MANTQWDKPTHTTNYDAGTWMHTYCQIPFLAAKIKRFVEEQGGAPWKALDVGCGMGKHTTMCLQAGASYVLAFDVSNDMVQGAKFAADKFLHSSTTWISKSGFCSSLRYEVQLHSWSRRGKLRPRHLRACNVQLALQRRGEAGACRDLQDAEAGWEAHHLRNTCNPVHAIGCQVHNSTPVQTGHTQRRWHEVQFAMRMNSGQEIKITNRFYTLSAWVTWILEAGFQITQFMEPHVEPKTVTADAPDYAKFTAGKPDTMWWECTKPVPQQVKLLVHV